MQVESYRLLFQVENPLGNIFFLQNKDAVLYLLLEIAQSQNGESKVQVIKF